jgi:ectoine hydroxylase-related dioxygenase (phytanoyl-CoA dioxygenase family)
MTPEQIQQYRTEGYTIVRNALPAKDLAALRSHVDEMLAHLPAGQRPEHLDMPHKTDPVLLDACRHPALLDLVEQLLGPNIALFASHMLAKAKGDGLEVPWHQDAEYWALDPMEVATLWLAVDESSVENGCMRVIPGTQTIGPLPHRTADDKDSKVLDRGIDISTFDPDSMVDIELVPGDLSFHAPYLVHGSNVNHSQKRRCGYTMRFIPTTTRLIRDGEGAKWWANHPLYLMRGEDRDGVNTYANASS